MILKEVSDMKKLMFRKPNVILYIIFLLIGFTFYAIIGLKCIYADDNTEEPCPKPYINSISPKAIMPGEKIKIRGNRFGKTKGDVIFFPDTKADIIKWTYKRIWVIVPKHAKTGSLFVSSSCGRISNKVHFTIKEGNQ